MDRFDNLKGMLKVLDLKKAAARSSSKNKVVTPEIQGKLDALYAVAGIISKEEGERWLEHARKMRDELDRGY